ncbi:hypothetical protein [Paenibacillus chitinolyticus]|nr:hypothetical protein [Paenibacillus chitinolyticus]MBV6715375.1 hypothetical protein [Paenibacillus chitinolyticus]
MNSRYKRRNRLVGKTGEPDISELIFHCRLSEPISRGEQSRHDQIEIG